MEMREIGLVEQALIRLFGKSYKTTVPGLVSAVCTPVIVADQFIAHPTLHTAAAVCSALVAGSVGAIGIAAKATNVTGVGADTRILPRKKR